MPYTIPYWQWQYRVKAKVLAVGGFASEKDAPEEREETPNG